VIPVVLVIGGLTLNFLAQSNGFQPLGVLGGPGFAASLSSVIEDEASLTVSYSIGEDFPIAQSQDEVVGFIFADSASVLSPTSPLSGILPGREGLLVYKVQSGDTLSSVAAQFGLSLETILSTNDSLKGRLLKSGQEILILPVSGVLHTAEIGETVDSVSRLYRIDSAKILSANRKLTLNGELTPGTSVIVPGATPRRQASVVASVQLPNLAGYFTIPVRGWNWGTLHAHNAIDIANACGTPIYSAAEGLISRTASPFSWNDGYGGLVQIQHPAGTATDVSTLYAHLQKNIVSIGDYVHQGDLIGYVGNTGKTHGPTGCHLHFEVRGARNPFAK